MRIAGSAGWTTIKSSVTCPGPFSRSLSFRYSTSYRPTPPRVAPRFPGDSPYKHDVGGRSSKEENTNNPIRQIRKRLWYGLAGTCIFIITVVVIPNLEKTPITQRWRVMLVSKEQEAALGAMASEKLLRDHFSHILPFNDPNVLLVYKITQKILAAALITFPELFPQGMTLSALLHRFPIHVVSSPMVNATVLPGILPHSLIVDGSIFVFSGIMPIAQDEAGLATILSHEVSAGPYHVDCTQDLTPPWRADLPVFHFALFRHHRTAGYRWRFLSMTSTIDSFIRTINDLLMRIGILLPNSRKTEIEADHIGLLLMAAACYDPKSAISFWQRMDLAANSPDSPVPKKSAIGQFLSTHPSHGKRGDHLEQRMPDAMKIWERANCAEQINPFWQRFRSW